MDQRQISLLLQRAVDAQRAGSRERANDGWRAVLEAAPEHPVALNALAADALLSGQPARAVPLFRRAAAADPASPDLLNNLARAQNFAGDVEGEKDSLERSIVLAPDAIGSRIRLAQLLERTHSSAAADGWRAVLALAPANAAAQPELSDILDHARGFLATQAHALGRDVDDALSSMRVGRSYRERRRIDAAFDYTLGRRGIYLNQCTGLHVPFLPADEFFDSALFPWIPALEATTSTIVAELTANLGGPGDTPEGFTPYIDLPAGVRSAQWSALDKSVQWSALHFWRDGVRDEDVCRRFPLTAAIIDGLPLAHLPKRMPTIFFSALQPHTHIPAHTGVTNARAIVHLPLIVPDGCRFRVGGETRAWEAGRALAFDDTIEHEAWNDSDALRVVLIMDAWNPHLTDYERTMIDAFYAASEMSAVAPTSEERTRFG